MAKNSNILNTTIKLRCDTVNNYASHPNHVPLKGEVCIVQPTAISPWVRAQNLRFKVGDGETAWKDLGFVDEDMKSILPGYYLNGKFYLDINHTQEVTEFDWRMLYIDLHKGVIYYYDEDKHSLIANVVEVASASDVQPGIMKLYQTHGQNTDGTMSQKAITDAIDAIKFQVNASDTEILELAKPW